MKKQLLTLALCLAALIPAQAQTTPIVFTVTATADAAVYGYVQNNPYTFVFTTTNTLTTFSSFTYGSATNFWGQEEDTDSRLWATVGGTGLTGTFSNPVVPSGAPYSTIEATGANALSLLADNDGMVGTGLYGGTSDELDSVYANSITVQGVNFSYSQTFTDPNLYFADYLGNYTATGGLTITPMSGGGAANFTVTNLSIAAAAIPEPSTYAIFAGVSVLGLAMYRRRKLAA